MFRLLVFTFFLFSCGKLNYSPYTAEVSDRKLNERNLDYIADRSSVFGNDFKVAVLSDTHDYYKNLEKQIQYINDNKDEIAFVIHTGDATNLGLLPEWEMYLDEMGKLEIPYVMVIGNHDLLSNGKSLYKKLFGNDLNMTFDFKQTRFILFNNNNWESSGTVPNTNYVEEQLSTSGQTHNLFFAHVQYDDPDRYTESEINVMENLVSTYGVSHVINGHNHNFGAGSFSTATRLTVGSSHKGRVLILSISDSGVSYEFKKF